MKPITDDEARSRLGVLQGWRLGPEGVSREFAFDGFPEAMAFAVRVGFQAEAANHHPEIRINYMRVWLAFTTHDAGGLTDKDFEGAVAASSAAAAMGGS